MLVSNKTIIRETFITQLSLFNFNNNIWGAIQSAPLRANSNIKTQSRKLWQCAQRWNKVTLQHHFELFLPKIQKEYVMCCCQCLNMSSPGSAELAYSSLGSGKACKNRQFYCIHHKGKHVKLLQFWRYFKREHSSCWVPGWNADLVVSTTPAAPTRRPRSRRICKCLLADAFLPWKDPPSGIYKVFSVDEQPGTLEGPFLPRRSKNQYHLETLEIFREVHYNCRLLNSS